MLTPNTPNPKILAALLIPEYLFDPMRLIDITNEESSFYTHLNTHCVMPILTMADPELEKLRKDVYVWIDEDYFNHFQTENPVPNVRASLVIGTVVFGNALVTRTSKHHPHFRSWDVSYPLPFDLDPLQAAAEESITNEEIKAKFAKLVADSSVMVGLPPLP